MTFRHSIKSIAERPAKFALTDAIKAAGLSHGEQSELARHMKVSRQAVNNWMQGKSLPSINSAYRAWDWLRARTLKLAGHTLEDFIQVDLPGRKALLREVYEERWGKKVGGNIPITDEEVNIP